jgi:hypothetical protein
VSKESITDLIAKLRKLEQRERVDHREHGPECMGAPSWETRLSRDLALVVDALEAVTVPTENERELAFRIADTLAYYRCRLNNPKADHPHMGYHAFSEDQREHLRAQQAEATGEILRIIAENSARLPVTVEPETQRTRTMQANEIAYLVIDQAKIALPKFFVTLDFRYGIADALWDLGYRRSTPLDPEQITEGGTQ